MTFTETTAFTGVLIAAIGQTLFVLFYATMPWWRSFLGRSLFFKAVVLAVLLDSVIWAWVTDHEWTGDVLAILYVVLAIGIWSQAIAFWTVRRQAFRERENVDDGNSA